MLTVENMHVYFLVIHSWRNTESAVFSSHLPLHVVILLHPLPEMGTQGEAGALNSLVTFRDSTQLSCLRPKKKDSCVQVSEVKIIRVGRSKNIFILEYFFNYNCTEGRRQGFGGQLL